jgi:hypothetical protein
MDFLLSVRLKYAKTRLTVAFFIKKPKSAGNASVSCQFRVFWLFNGITAYKCTSTLVPYFI